MLLCIFIIFRQVSTSFGCDYDEGKNLALGELYREIAYGILPELVSHALKINAQIDGLFPHNFFTCSYPTSTGDFTKMYKMVIDIFCYLASVCSVELMTFLFSTFASLLPYFNEQTSTSELQKIVMYKLCYYMLPLCLGRSLVCTNTI